jgi:LysM repeat protein
VDELRSWNNLSNNTISIGQKLVIRKVEQAADIAQPETATDQKKHKVLQDETIYSISRRYDISAQELRTLNNLSSNSLEVGQVLVLPDGASEKEESNGSNSSMLPVKVEEEQAAFETADSQSEVTEEIVASTETNYHNDEDVSPPESRSTEKIVQKGMAEVNEQRSETKKYLGLHRDAPIGTIMQVRNEMNNQSVFVRIVGTIPDTGDNAKVILKISQKAYDRLGAVDSRFPVEISYMP